MKEIIIGLVAVMLANILLGATLAKFKENFKKEVFFKGVFKALCVVSSISLVYLCGYLNPTILAVEINGKVANLIEALRLVFIAGILLYGKEDIQKIIKLFQLDMDIKEAPINYGVDDSGNDNNEIEAEDNEISISR